MKVDIPEGKNGEWTIEKFTVDRIDFHALFHGRSVPVGETFTRLKRNGYLVMSDTPAEVNDHRYFINNAKGKVLIAGLGIGMVINAIAKRGEVEHITVIEISKELIDLVGPYYKEKLGDKLEIINADILTWKPQKDAYYDYAWYDIWDAICSDNLEDMKKLHRKFGRKTGWQGSWTRAQCERIR